MKRSRLFGSILAAMAGIIGVNQTATDTPQIISTQRASVQQQRPDTSTPATAPVSNAVVNVRAGATVVPIPTWITATPRWAWVGRKVNGRFGYYCKRAGVRNG